MTLSRSAIRKLVVMLACAALVLMLAYVALTPMRVTALARYLNYWLCLAITIAFGYALWAVVRRWDVRAALWRHRVGALVVVACGIFLQLHEPHRFKVLFDEHALAGVARQMHFQRTDDVPARVHFVDGHLAVLNAFVDKRRAYYPFLVSMLHDVTGYRPANSWILNGLLGFVLLGLVYGWGNLMGGPRYGILATLLLTGVPLLAQAATGGGLDLLNTTLIVGFLLALYHYHRSEGVDGLDLCVVLVVMLATTRYESAVYLAPLGLVALAKWRRERAVTLTWLSALSPLLLACTVFSNRVWPPNDVYFHRFESGSLFSFHHLAHNLPRMAYFLFAPPTDAMTNSLLLGIVGVIALAMLLASVSQWRTSRKTAPAGTGVFLGVLAAGLFITLLTQLYYWGMLDDPMSNRFALTPCILLVLTVPVVLAWGFRRPRLPGWVVALPALWVVAWAAPQDARHGMTDELVGSAESQWWIDWAAQHLGPRDLMLGDSAIGFVLYGHPAESYDYLSIQPTFDKLRNSVEAGTYDSAYTFERRFLDPSTGQVAAGGKMAGLPGLEFVAPADLVLEPVAEMRYRPFMLSIISKVVGIRDKDGTVHLFKKHPPPPQPNITGLRDWYYKNLP